MLSRRLDRVRPGDEGFTLIELIISIGLLGIIFSVLSLVMLTSVRANAETEDRLDETRDEQFAAAYFASDVAGATEVAAGATARCGSGTAVVELRGLSFTAASPAQQTTTVTSYVFTTSTVDGVTTGALVRRTCENVTAGMPAYPWTATATTPVAGTLATTAPVVTCRTGATVAACSAATTRVSVSFARLSGGTPFVLSATRRTS